MSKRLIAGGAWVELRINGKKMALVSGCSYNQDFQVQPATVINQLGPISYDSQGYQCTINIGFLVAKNLTNLYIDDNPAQPLIPDRDEVSKDGKMPEFSMEFVERATGKVIDSFEGVILSTDSKSVQPNTYVTSDLNFFATKKVSGTPG